MAQAPVQKASVPDRGSRNKGRFATFVGAMALGAVLALGGSAAASSPRPATDNDRAVVRHIQSERAETPSSGTETLG